jgi:ParB family transcriptional regulator, chromosome partitioning protein
MSKLDELRRTMGANVTESASRRGLPAAPTAPALGNLSAARMAGVSRSKNAMEIPVDRIVPDPDQPRDEFDEEALARLAESLRTRGQLQPIRVRWDEGRGAYVVVVGERRWRAAGMAGMPTLTCVVAEGDVDAGELLALQLIENCVREDLLPVEQARAYRTLMDRMGWSGNRLAQELGIAQSGVVHALALLELPAAVQEQVERGTLPASTAYEISKVDDPEVQAELAARVVSEGMNRSSAIEAVRKSKGKGRGAGKSRGKASRLPAEVKHRASNGVRMVATTAARHDLADLAAALLEFLDKVRAEINAEGEQRAA